MAGLYNYRWQQRRKGHLQANPLCVRCEKLGQVTAATVADHITPHKDDPTLFDGPIQSLCKACHDGWKQAQEHGSADKACDAQGNPIDPTHPWNIR